MNRKAFTTRTVAALQLGAALSLTAALAACGPDEASVGNGEQLSLLNSGGVVQWPGNTFGMLDGGFPGEGALPPLPDAIPMETPSAAPSGGFSRPRYAGSGASGPSYASSSGEYGYAPAYYDDYYPDAQDYYDPGESIAYDDGADSNTYAYLALAALLGGVLADSPPDYGFRYDGVQPWVWETGDRYVRYAEPIQSGYRYYYYEPNAQRPFLVRDPYYSYGYRQNRLVAIYDRDGRVIDRDRMLRQRRIAERYYDRGHDLYRAGNDQPRYGVAAPLWARQRAQIVRSQTDWDRARDRRNGWRSWDQRYQPVTDARWSQEQVVRRYAGQRFANWQKTDYRGTAPRFYREAVRDETVRRDIRVRQTVVMRERQEIQRRVEIERRNRGGEANDVRARQMAASQQRAIQMRERRGQEGQAGRFTVADQQRIVNRQADARRQQFATREQGDARRQPAQFAARPQAEVRRSQVAQRAVERRQQEQARTVRQQKDVRRTQVAQQAETRRQQAQSQAQTPMASRQQGEVRRTQASQQAQARTVRQQGDVRRTQVEQQAEARRQQAQSQAQVRKASRQQNEARRTQVTQQADTRRQQSQIQAQSRAVSQQRQVEARRSQAQAQAQTQSRQVEMRQQRASQMQAQRTASAAQQRQAQQAQRQQTTQAQRQRTTQAQRQQTTQAQRQETQRQSAQVQQRQMQTQQRQSQVQQARIERSSSPARQPGRQGYGRAER